MAGKSRFVSPLRSLLALLGCLLIVIPGWAGPQEDYEEGNKRVRRGDIVGAMEPLRKSAEGGNAKGQALYAYLLRWSDDLEAAAKWYRKSAEAGEAEGEYGLGTLYMSGEGVKRDTQEGRRWFEKAAAKNHELAVRALATGIVRGEFKVAESEQAQAVKWLTSASEFGALDATEALAKAYRSGGWGLAADAKLAEQYQAKAANLRGPKAKSDSGGKK